MDKQGKPGDGFMPGMDIHAALTVVGDGPVGPIGQQLDAHFGLPEGHHTRDWAVGMKFVVDLPEDTPLKPGTVLHTFGYPEPEIFGFLYVHPDRVASLGIFVPSWFDSPMRTAYRYLQHWMLHPYLWRYLKGGKLRSWGAKTLGESGRRGEPHLVGDGYARIGEGSGSTNVLTGSGVDEAWATGAQLAESVLELLKAKKPFTKAKPRGHLRQAPPRELGGSEARVAEKSRDGFQKGVVRGMIGMALAGLTNGRFALSGEPVPPYERIPTLEEYYRGRIPAEEIEQLRKECAIKGVSLHGALMERVGWPAIPYDGQLLVSHQDALLLGGKVQAPPGYADHVVFLYPELCEKCGTKICIELCSGQAITPGEAGVPAFDREKCVHCGACLLELRPAHPRQPRAHEHRLPRRHRRPALGGELSARLCPRRPGSSRAVLTVLLPALVLLGSASWGKKREVEQSGPSWQPRAGRRGQELKPRLADLKDKLAESQARIEELQKEKDAALQTHQSLEDEMRAALESKDVTISQLQGKLTVNILDRVLFDSGEADLKPAGAAVLRKVAAILAQHPDLKIHVIGHTDNVPIRAAARNRFPSNWELSTARATAAVRFLTENAGVDPRRLGAVGYGEFRPVADNATPEGRARNRRIAITILSEEMAGADVPQIVTTNSPAPPLAPAPASGIQSQPLPMPPPLVTNLPPQD